MAASQPRKSERLPENLEELPVALRQEAGTRAGSQRGRGTQAGAGDHQMIEPIKASPLTLALRVNGLVICDCGHDRFRIGITYDTETENNFIRVLECADCGSQMPVIHRADSGLAPSVGFHS
jgi:hypothetical protein